jgi:hypothetical protein
LHNAGGEEARCYLARERDEYVVTLEEPAGCTRAISVDDLAVAVSRSIVWCDELTDRGWNVVGDEAASGE